MTLLEELIKVIKANAEDRIAEDDEDFCVNDYAGGNMDDAYQMGVGAGYTMFARELQKIIEDRT